MANTNEALLPTRDDNGVNADGHHIEDNKERNGSQDASQPSCVTDSGRSSPTPTTGVVGDNQHENTGLHTSMPVTADRNSAMQSDVAKATDHDANVSVHPANCEQAAAYDDELRLDLLPTELILHICSFLHAKVLIHTLSKVCRSLHSLLTDTTFWKVRIAKRWPKKYPAIPVDSTFNWTEACIQREEQHRLWSRTATTMDYYRFTEGVFAPVDSVHLMQNGKLLATGSRDRYLNLLDLSRLESGNPASINGAKLFTKMDAHKGWIWSMASSDNVLATGSWDTYIKFWDLAADAQELRQVKCKSAILCTHFEDGLFLAGGYDAKVYHIDPRSADIVATKRYHKKPVLSLAADDNYIITGSEDKTIAIYDRRADSVYKTLTFDSYPMSLSYGMDQLWVGDKTGGVHLVDATDGDFNLVETYDVGHNGHKVTGIIHTLGAMFTCSTDKTIKVLHPTVSPDVIATLATQKAEVAGIDFQNDILVSANSDVSVGIWVPRPLDSPPEDS